MPDAILCAHCNKPTNLKEAYNCSQCSKFFCDNCTVEKDEKILCVSCFSSVSSNATRKVLDEVLARRGVKLEAPKMVFRGMEIKELSGIRVNQDNWEYRIKCFDKGEKSFTVERETFDQLWKKAQELGYKTERVPFGQKIMM